MRLSYSAAQNVLLRMSIILPQTLPFLKVKRPEREADQPPTYRLGLRVLPHGVPHSYALEHPEQWPAYNLRLVLKACSINSSCYSYTIHYTADAQVQSEGIKSKVSDGKCCSAGTRVRFCLQSQISSRRRPDPLVPRRFVCERLRIRQTAHTAWHSYRSFVSLRRRRNWSSWR